MKVAAFAKINLALEVLGRRSDGYHKVLTVIHSLDLADEVEITPGPDLRLECSDPVLSGEVNLAWQAAQALAPCLGRPPQAHIYIKKRIPTSMGLGGGSSDAAAVLQGLNRLWELNLSKDNLTGLAATIGADVPYFLYGGSALAKGRGDVVEPLPTLPATPVTLVCPHETLDGKTGRLYDRLTPAHYSDGALTRRMVEKLRNGAEVAGSMTNVFEAVAYSAFPGLRDLRCLVEEVTGQAPRLSGAGPALFCLPSSEAEYFRLAEALQPYPAKAYFVRTLSELPPLC